MNEKVLNAIYSNLSKADTTFTATYDQFKTLMNDSNVRNAVYDNIRKMDSSATGTNQQFDELLGYSTKFEAEADKAADAGVANLRNKKYEALSDDEVYEQWNSILAKGEQNKAAKISKTKKEQEQFAAQKPLLNAISQMQDINQSGIKPTTPIESLQAQHASLFLDPSDLEEYKSLDKERGVRIHMSGNQDAKTNTVNSSNIVKDIRDRAARDNKKLSASERIDLNMAERINDMSQELIEAPSKFGEESGVSNWWQGMTDTLFDRDIISVVGMVRDWEVSSVVKKLNDGEELTESENALIVAVANFDEVQKSRSSDLSTGYEIGKGTAQCVPLVIDMMVTKGLGTAGKKTLIKSLDKLVKAGKMSQKSLNNFARILNGTEGISYTVGKGDDAVKVTVGALEGGAKKTLGQYAGDAARELVETGIQTYAMPSSQRQMIQAKTDLRRELESNDISFKDRARIFGDAYTQTFTERAGGKAIDWTLGKVFGMSNVLQKFGFDRGILKLLNSAVQNPVSEVGEEYLGAVINLVRSADLFDLYSEQSNEELRDEAMSMFTSDGFWKTVGTVLPMSLFGGAANYSKIKAETRKFNQSNLELSQYLQSTGMTKSQADNILRQIEGAKDSSELNERMSILKTYLTNYIMSNNTDTEVAKGKLEAMNELVGTHANNISTYEDAIGGLKYALSSMSKEAKEKVAEDFKNLTNKANESITITPEKEGKDITPAAQDASGWTKNKYKVTIDGKKENVTIQGELFFNEDGSINSSRTDLSRVHIQNASGKNIRTTVKADKKKEVFNKYLDAINDELRKQKAEKDADAIATQKAEEVKKAELAKLKAEEKEKLDKKIAEIEAQEQSIAAQEADRQSIIASFPKDKNGEVDIDKMSPEQFFVYESDTDTPEAAMNTVGDVLNDLYNQLENNANEANREKQARNAAKIKNRIRQYEAVVVKYAGQETLDAINAARVATAAPVVEPAPVEEEPAVSQEQAPAVEQVAEPESVQEVEQSATEEVGETKDAAIEENKTGEEVQKPSYDIETEVNDGTIKLLFSPNSKGQWYVLRNGEVISRSLNANRKKLPDNTREVADAKVKYIKTADDNYIPILLFSESTKNDTLKGEKQVMLQDGSVTIVKASEMFDKISDNEYIPTQSNTTKKEAQRKERAKYSTFDAVLKYPVVNFSDGTVLTFADVLGLGFEKKKNSQYVTPYDRVIEMINTKESNEDVIAGKKKAFREDFKKVAQYWNAVVDAKYEGNEKLKMAVDLSVGKHDTSGRVMASSMIAADNAID